MHSSVPGQRDLLRKLYGRLGRGIDDSIAYTDALPHAVSDPVADAVPDPLGDGDHDARLTGHD